MSTHKPNILLVDDSAAARFLVRDLLAPVNAEIEEAENGRDALGMVSYRPYDLVITDMDMPEMDGIAFCRAFKDMADCRAVPAIMLSSFDSERDIGRGFEAGVEAYVSKSEVKSQLLPTVKRVLSAVSFRRKRVVLVVDDSVSIRRAVEEGLTRAGFGVVTAEGGAAALERMARNRPDLILSDLDMPEMNGAAFCRAVKSSDRLSAIPFVVMSGNRERGRMKGMIEWGAAAYITKPFNVDELVILVEKLLSDHVALILKDRERLELERNLMLAGITSLISALEARDVYTRGHSDAVARILSEMVALTGAGPADVEMALIAGRLHDIGKIGVPDSILLKADRLTEAEFAQIKKHPEIGKNILDSIPSLSRIVPIVHLHHERWDGRGYPLGLEADQIPLWARFTSVADTFHALVSDRPYRRGMPEERALQIIREENGAQFCPRAVETFFEWYGRKHIQA